MVQFIENTEKIILVLFETLFLFSDLVFSAVGKPYEPFLYPHCYDIIHFGPKAPMVLFCVFSLKMPHTNWILSMLIYLKGIPFLTNVSHCETLGAQPTIFPLKIVPSRFPSNHGFLHCVRAHVLREAPFAKGGHHIILFGFNPYG